MCQRGDTAKVISTREKRTMKLCWVDRKTMHIRFYSQRQEMVLQAVRQASSADGIEQRSQIVAVSRMFSLVWLHCQQSRSIFYE